MTEHNLTYDQEQHVESHAPYLTVFFVLLNYTAMEYVYAKAHTLSILPLALLATAISLTIFTSIFAGLFHLQFNRRWVYLTIVPAVLLSFFPFPLVLGLMVLAITKAALVGFWFMHLKFEGKWVYFWLLPAGFLAAFLTLALYPDIAMQPTEQAQEIQEEELSSLPAFPAPSRIAS